MDVEPADGDAGFGSSLVRVTTSSAEPQLVASSTRARCARLLRVVSAISSSLSFRKNTGPVQTSAPGREGVPAQSTPGGDKPRDQVAELA